jgi:hypothetical protein
MIDWKISKSNLNPRILQQLESSWALLLLDCKHALDEPLRWLRNCSFVAVLDFPSRDEPVEFLLVACPKREDSNQHEV